MEATERFSGKRLDRSGVAERLQPVIELHGIEVKENHIEFPDVRPCVGLPESYKENEPAAIYFEDIVSISPFDAHIEVLLRSGELYTFSTKDTIKTHVNTYKSGDKTVLQHRQTTAQDIAGNIWDSLEKSLAGKK